MHEAIRPARIDHEACRDADRLTVSCPREVDVIAGLVEPVEGGLVEIVHAGSLRFAHQCLIEVRPIPVRVADLVGGTRRNHQLPIACVSVVERRIELVKEEREAALESARHI